MRSGASAVCCPLHHRAINAAAPAATSSFTSHPAEYDATIGGSSFMNKPWVTSRGRGTASQMPMASLQTSPNPSKCRATHSQQKTAQLTNGSGLDQAIAADSPRPPVCRQISGYLLNFRYNRSPMNNQSVSEDTTPPASTAAANRIPLMGSAAAGFCRQPPDVPKNVAPWRPRVHPRGS